MPESLLPVMAPEEIEESLRDREAALVAGQQLDTSLRGIVSEAALASISSAIDLIGANRSDSERHDFNGNEHTELGSVGTALVVQEGFARLQTVNVNLDKKPDDSPHGHLLRIAQTLPESRKIFPFGGLRLVLRRLAVIEYLPHARLARLPLTAEQEAEALEQGFPTSSGHRDRMPATSVISSEQLTGEPSQWRIVNMIGESLAFRQEVGQIVLMRSEFRGMSDGRPWHDVENNSTQPRLTLITAYGV